MSNETLDHNHWVLDNDMEDEGFARFQKLAIESIKSQIDKANLMVDENTSVASNENHPVEEIFIKNQIKNPYNLRSKKILNFYGKMQQWIGVINEIAEKSFSAKLYDQYDDSSYEVAEFEFAEVSKSDSNLLKLGAIFYYNIGFASNNGQIKKESFLRFKRSVPFKNKDLDVIEERVKDLNENINWQ